MARKRRTPEEARTAILDAAEALVLESGAQALRLRAIAEKVGVSHPAVLHHFASLDDVLAALHRRLSLRIRDDVLARLAAGNTKSPVEAAQAALAELGDRDRGRLIAWLVAEGKDPFPPVEDRGLALVVDMLEANSDRPRAELDELVEMAVFATLGEALFGPAIRARLGHDELPDAGDGFRARLLGRLVGGTGPQEP
jgi:AcrR family transcriptional regulator